MKVLVAGATGVVGRPLVRILRERGHEVVGTTRGPGRARWMRELGAELVGCDALDADAVSAAVRRAPPGGDRQPADRAVGPAQPPPLPRVDRADQPNCAASAPATSSRRRSPPERGMLVSQSIAFAYRWDGTGLKTEDDPLFDHDLGFADAVVALEASSSG